MKNIPIMLLIVFFIALYSNNIVASEKAVQHRLDVTSYKEAKQVFSDTTSKLKENTTLDGSELNEIHMITYSLEKAVAYFAENMNNKQQMSAKKIANVVELIHIASENNRTSETGVYLEEYFKLADEFMMEL